MSDAAIRLVERGAVRASLKEEQEKLRRHEEEAKKFLRRENVKFLKSNLLLAKSELR